MSEDIAIRPTKLSDYEQIAGLLPFLQAVHRPVDWFTQEVFSSMLKRNEGLYLVAVHDSKVVGSIFATHDGGYLGYLYKLVVAPEYRRQGVARRLTEAAMVKLKELGIDWMYCHIEKDNAASLKFFKQLGFNVRATHHLVDNF